MRAGRVHVLVRLFLLVRLVLYCPFWPQNRQCALVISSTYATSNSSFCCCINWLAWPDPSLDIGLDELSSGSRQKRISEPLSVAALLVRDIDHISLMELSLGLKRDLSGLSQAASRLDKRMKKNRELTERINSIKETIR